MLYLDYEQAKAKYRNAQIIYSDILDEQEELFTKYMPRAVRYDQEKVTGGAAVGDAFASYMVKKEQLRLDERLAEVEELLDARGRMLAKRMDELKQSKKTLDRIYYKRYVLGLKVAKIAIDLNYSESHIYRCLDQIQKEIQVGLYLDKIDKERISKQR